jgi:hypothetical protein
MNHALTAQDLFSEMRRMPATERATASGAERSTVSAEASASAWASAATLIAA